MTEPPELSVLVVAHNAGGFLLPALRSVLDDRLALVVRKIDCTPADVCEA